MVLVKSLSDYRTVCPSRSAASSQPDGEGGIVESEMDIVMK